MQHFGDEICINGTIFGATVACVRVPAQTPTGGGLAYENVANGDVTVNATVTGIEYTEVGFSGSETVANDGTYTADVLVGGTIAGGVDVNITWGLESPREHFDSLRRSWAGGLTLGPRLEQVQPPRFGVAGEF